MRSIFERYSGPPDQGMCALREAMRAFFKKAGLGSQIRHSDVEKIWKMVVGEELASRTRVKRVCRGVVEVEVNSSALVHELVSFHREALLHELQQRLPKRFIRRIEFKVGEF